MKKLLLWLMLGIVSTPAGWKVIDIDPNPDNVGVRIVTWCYSGTRFQWVNYQGMEDSATTEMEFRREEHKGSTNCTVFVDVIRARYNEDKRKYEDPNKDYDGESLSVDESKIEPEPTH